MENLEKAKENTDWDHFKRPQEHLAHEKQSKKEWQIVSNICTLCTFYWKMLTTKRKETNRWCLIPRMNAAPLGICGDVKPGVCQIHVALYF